MDMLKQAEMVALLEHAKGPGMAVSYYADLTVAQGFESHWLGHFKHEIARIKPTLADDLPALEGFERDINAVRAALESDEAKRARGFAVFSAQSRGYLRAIPLDVPVENRLVFSDELYLVPLVEAMDRQRACLVVVTDTHRGRLYAATPGRAEQLGEFEEEVPKQRRASGQRAGKERGHAIERHRRDAILHHQKLLAGAVERAWDADDYHGIILLGQRDVVSQFRSRLPQRLAACVFHEAPYPWNGHPPEIHRVVESTRALEQRDAESRLTEEVARRLAQGYGIAAGPQEVIDALRNGQVHTVVLGPDPGSSAGRCTACGSIFAAAVSACGYCANPCEKRNLWEQVLAQSLRHNVKVRFAPPSPLLERHGRIAAILTREEPWAAAS